MRRGTTNQNMRGNSRDRQRRRQWLLDTFGDGATCPCHYCGELVDDVSITVDRIVPGAEGGRYVRSNIRPACSKCNTREGAKLGATRRWSPEERMAEA